MRTGKTRLHYYIFAGMILGAVLGWRLWVAEQGDVPDWHWTLRWVVELCGPVIFMSALKMIIAPLIFASIVAGVTSLPNMRELGSIGWKTLAYYGATTAVAVTIGLVLVLIIQPGKQPAAQGTRAERAERLAELEQTYEDEEGESARNAAGDLTDDYRVWLYAEQSGEQEEAQTGATYRKVARAKDRTPGEIFVNDIVRPLLTNPFESLSTTNSLGLIFFAVLLGIACTLVGAPAQPVVSFFQGLNAVILEITHWLMMISPVAIGCIVADLVATNGLEVFQTLGWYAATVIGGILIHVVFLLAVAWTLGGKSPLDIWRGIREAWMIAFSTRSSAATLPVTLSCVTQKMRVSPKVANFSLPLGATMNMDGTALYEGVAVIFLIQVYGGLADVPIALTGMATFLIFITAVLASVGAAAVPDAGLVTMVLVANAVGLPVYYLPLIFAIDAFLDMFRTSTNVLGDVVGATVISRLERGRLGEPAAP